MKRRFDAIAVAALLLCAAVVVGEVLTYYPGVHSYDASAEWGDDTVSYTVHSSGSDVYDAVLISNEGRSAVSSIVVFVDENYDSFYSDATRVTEVSYLSQEYYFSEIREALRSRSYDAVSSVDSEGLAAYMEETLSDPSGLGIVVSSYSLPTAVYDGTSGCLLMRWMQAGGTVYWLCTEAGRFHCDADGLHEVQGNQTLLFGTECLNTDGEELGDKVVDTGYTDALSLKNSNMQNALDATKVSGSLAMGYSTGGYASTVAVPMGSGQMFVVSGFWDFDLVDDFAQIVAAGVTVDSTISGHVSGTVTRGDASGSIDVPASGEHVLYLYIGGTYTKYGGAFHG